MKLITFFLLNSLFITACGGEDAQKVNPPLTKPQNSGPFVVQFNAKSEYEHLFVFNYPNNSGKVEYFIKTKNAEDIQLIKNDLIVTGCSSAEVTYMTYWLPDSRNNYAYAITAGSTFSTGAETQGTLMYVIYGIQGCSQIQIKTKLLKY